MAELLLDDVFAGSSDQPSTGSAVPASPEPAPPPQPIPREERRSSRPTRPEPDPDLLPPAYRAADAARRPRTSSNFKGASLDDIYGLPPASEVSGSKYDPSSDWAITRGLKAGREGAEQSLKDAAEVARVAMLPKDQQAAAMLAPQAVDPYATQLQVPGLQDIGGVGDFFTYIGEQLGNMAGSYAGAIEYGGGPGAATGAAVGGAAGAVGGAGVGAAPGAAAGAVTGFTYGTGTAFVGMGIGGMYRDLLNDKGVQEALKNGTLDPSQVLELSVGAGTVIGLIDAIPGGKYIGKALGTKEVSKDAVKLTIKQAIKKGLIHGALEEGGTEGLQGAISEIGQAVLGGQTNLGTRVMSVVNQAVGGAIGGAGAGVVGEVTENQRIPERTAPATPGTSSGGATPPPTTPAAGTAGPGTGTGTVPPPPAGSTPSTTPPSSPAVTALPAGGVDPGIAAAASATAEAPGAEATEGYDPEEEGEFDTGPAIAPTTKPDYSKPAPERVTPVVAEPGAPPDVQAAVAASTPRAPTGPQPAQAPPAPQAPAAPAPQPSAQIQPGEFSPEQAASMQPAQPVRDMTEGLPDYGAAPPLPDVGAPAEADAGEPATPVGQMPPQPVSPVEPTGEPTPVDIAQPDLNDQIAAQQAARQTKAERAKMVARERALEPVRRYASQLTTEPVDIEDGARRLLKLDETFRTEFLKAMPPGVADAVEARAAAILDRGDRQIARQPAAAQAPVSAEPRARVPEPPPAPASPRPSVALRVKKPPKGVPARTPATSERVSVTLTPELYQRGLLHRGAEETHRAMVDRGVARNKKSRRRHMIMSIEDGQATLRGAGKRGAPLTLPVSDLVSKYDVEVSDVLSAGKQGAIPVKGPSELERFATAARQHFRVAKAKAIKLAGHFTPEQISVLERAGMAANGTMDASEFARWDAHQRGPTVPGTRAEPTDRAQFERESARLTEKPPTPFTPLKTSAQKADEETARREAERAQRKEEQAAEAAKEPGHAGRFPFRKMQIGEQPATPPRRATIRKGFTEAAQRAAAGWKARKRPMHQALAEAIEAELPERISRDVGAIRESGITEAVAKDALAKARKAFPRSKWQPREMEWVKDADGDLVQQPTGEASGKARYQTLTQGELHQLLDAAIGEAEKAFAAWDKEKTEANTAAAEKIHNQVLAAWRQLKKENARTGSVTGHKNAVAVRGETADSTLAKARAELKLFEKGQEAGRDPHLLKIARKWRDYMAFGRKAMYAKARERIAQFEGQGTNRTIVGGEIRQLMDARIAAAEKVDIRLEREQAALDKKLEAEKELFLKQHRRMVDLGIVEEGQMETETKGARAEISKFRTAVTRSLKSGPALRKVVEQTKLPGVRTVEEGGKLPPRLPGELASDYYKRVAPSETTKLNAPAEGTPAFNRWKRRMSKAKLAREQAGVGGPVEKRVAGWQFIKKGKRVLRVEREENLTDQIRAGLKQFVADAEAALRKAGSTLPTKLSERFNTLEENAVIFVKQMLQQRRGRKELRSLSEGQEQLHGPKSKGGLRLKGEPGPIEVGDAHRNYDVNEAHTILYLLKRGDPQDAAIIYDMMFERARTESVALRGQGLSQRSSAWTYRQGRQAVGPEVEDEEAHAVDPTELTEEEKAYDVSQEMEDRMRQRWGIEYSEAPEGWGSVEGGAKLEPDDISAVEDIIRQVAGLDKVSWAERLKVGRYVPAHGKVIEEAAGQYSAVDDVVTLVKSLANKGIAFHEAFHRLQALFLNDRQRAVLRAELPRLRQLVGRLEAGVNPDAKASEIEADAFRAHAAGLIRVPGRVAMAWLKLKQAVRRVHNYMAGRGFQTSEDIFRKAMSGEIAKQPKRGTPIDFRTAYMAAPASTTALSAFHNEHWKRLVNNAGTYLNRGGFKKAMLKVLDTETMRRHVAEQFFGGNYVNPYSRYVDAHLNHERLVEDMMREGDKLDDKIRRWETTDPARTQQLKDTYEALLEGSIDGVDPRKPIAATASAAKKAMHARLEAVWSKATPELQKLLSDRADLMMRQMETHERKWAETWLQNLIDNGTVKLPSFLTKAGAVRQLMSGKLSPGFEAELGKNAQTLKDARDLGKYTRKAGIYLPAFRAGSHFITGRYDIATPSVTHGSVAFDKAHHDKTGTFRWEFTDERDADAYREKMASTGEHRVLKAQRKYLDPKTGTYLPGQTKYVRDAAGKILYPAEPRYFVVMQDRFMAMSDSIADLEQQRADLEASGEFKHVTAVRELAQHLESGNVPLALQRMLNNIDSMTGVDEATKRVSKQMVTNSFIQTQQGNRLSKRLLRRSGVHGYKTGAADMYHSFNSHNEMMSRNIVSMDRVPELRAAKSELMEYRDALADPTKRAGLSPAVQALVTRDLAKHGTAGAVRLGNYIAELNNRVEGSMQPRKPGVIGDIMRVASQFTTMAYLGTPSYYAIQMLGWVQTFQRMAAKHGMGKAYRHMINAYSDANAWSLMGKGATEGWAEARQFATRDFRKAGLFREGHDFVANLIANYRANGAANLDMKIRAFELARELGHLGQAGLDQANLRMRSIEGSKFLKGVEQMTRVFRAMQEGIETVNRAVPIAAYIDIMKEEGKLSDDEIIKRAVTAMVNEQTSYAKGNWGNWMQMPVLQPALMFKKFAITQAITFYESLARVVHAADATPEERKAARTHLLMVTLSLGALGGLSGNPLWEPARMGLYLLYWLGLMDPETWDETKTRGEKMLSDMTGSPMVAETLMYGLPRLAGIDVSSRVASDNLLTFAQPEDFTQDDFLKLAGSIAVGAPGALAMGGVASVNSAIQGDIGKALQQLPLPKMVRDMLKGYDQAVNGIKTATGVNTGAALNIGEALATSAGFRTRTQVRPFEQGSVAQKKAKDRVKINRQSIIQQSLNDGLTADVMRQVRAWNAAHPLKEERITPAVLRDAKKRRRGTEQAIRKANQMEGVM